MHTLAFVNQKGGCGKTTTAVNLAGALAAGGERTLLLDLDPQAHATLALGASPEGGPTLADVLLREVPVDRALRPAAPGIDLVPGCIALAEFEEAAERVLHAEGFLAGALADVGPRYDRVLIDCPPRADGVLTANALRAADTAVLVVETGTFALQGALQALAILEEVAGRGAFALRVVATLFDRRLRLARELLIGIQARFGAAMFDTVIHSSVRLREAAAYGVPVHSLDPASRAAADFTALAAEVRRAPGPSAAAPATGTPFPPSQRGVRATWTG